MLRQGKTVKMEKPMRRYADQRIYKIEERLKGAFKPLLCVVEVTDYEAKLNFKVFNVIDDNNESVFEKKDIVIRNLHDENYLQDLIQGALEAIEAKGFVLIEKPPPSDV
jgi:hypothetical protein